jgi:mono/diheme cytochrome c family protein
MNKRILSNISIIISILGLLSAWSGSINAQQTTLDFFGEINDEDHSPGYREYIENGCWQCHGFQGQGGERTDGPRLAPNPMPFEAFLNLVRRPVNLMPAYSLSVINDDKLKRIYEYLQSIPPSPVVSDIPLLSGE